jgi:hypothetical protein
MSSAVAIKPVPDDVAKTRPEGMPFIHSDLDDADLTIDEFRVAAHLARRMGPIIMPNGSVRWVAYPSLNSIAKTCFHGTYPGSSIDSLRRKAFQAIEGLKHRCIIEVQHRHSETEGQLSNLYFFNSKEHWQAATLDRACHPSIRKPRSKMATPDLPVITSRSPADKGTTPDLPVIPPRQTALKQYPPDLPVISPRSPGDHKVYPDELNPIPEKREREARSREEEQQAVSNPEPELAIALPTQEPLTEPPVKPEISGDDTCATAAPNAVFDAKNYDWSRYQKAANGGSDRRFFDWMVKRTETYSERRVRSGKEAIGDAQAYAVARIQKDGQTYYREFELEHGLRAPEPKPKATRDRASPSRPPEFAWTDWEPDNEPPTNLSDSLTMVKYCWGELKLGWDDPQWLDWLQKAQAKQAFEWQDKRSGFAHLPDWALRHLAHDMQIPFGGG